MCCVTYCSLAMDLKSPILGQAIGRWGNFMNQKAQEELLENMNLPYMIWYSNDRLFVVGLSILIV